WSSDVCSSDLIDGPDERWPLCVSRRHGWAMDQAQRSLLALGTLRHRRRFHRPRRDRRLGWQREEVAVALNAGSAGYSCSIAYTSDPPGNKRAPGVSVAGSTWLCPMIGA